MRSQRGTQQKLREHLKDNCEGAGRNNKRLTLNPHGSHNGHREKLISALVRRANEHGGQMDDLGGRVTERCASFQCRSRGCSVSGCRSRVPHPWRRGSPLGKWWRVWVGFEMSLKCPWMPTWKQARKCVGQRWCMCTRKHWCEWCLPWKTWWNRGAKSRCWRDGAVAFQQWKGPWAAGRSAWDRTPASAPRGFLREPRSSTGVGAESTRVVRGEAVGRNQSRELSHVVVECLFSFACLRLFLKSYLNTYMPQWRSQLKQRWWTVPKLYLTTQTAHVSWGFCDRAGGLVVILKRRPCLSLELENSSFTPRNLYAQLLWQGSHIWGRCIMLNLNLLWLEFWIKQHRNCVMGLLCSPYIYTQSWDFICFLRRIYFHKRLHCSDC